MPEKMYLKTIRVTSASPDEALVCIRDEGVETFHGVYVEGLSDDDLLIVEPVQELHNRQWLVQFEDASGGLVSAVVHEDDLLEET